MIERVSGVCWEQPEIQPGWTRVKHNGRREVWCARIDGQTYYLKYYMARRFRLPLLHRLRRAACRSEWEGGQYALRVGITAALPCGYATGLTRNGRSCDLLVTEAIEPATALNDFWQTLQRDPDVGRRRADEAQLTELLACMIARAHQAGFEHLDMHAANILVQPLGPRRYRTCFIDLQSARMGVPISDRAVVRNLAQLNQWFRRHSSVGQRLRFLRSYLRWRHEFETAFELARPLGLKFDELVLALRAAAERHARHLCAQRDRRAGREGSYFSRLKLGGGWRATVFRRSKHAIEASRVSQIVFEPKWWRHALRDPLRWLTGDAASTCKASHSGIVSRAVLEHPDGNIPVIVKRPLARNWQRKFAMSLAPSRSRRSWQTGYALLHRDIPTPRPLAVIERRVGPFVRDSLLVTEAVPGAADLDSWLRVAFPAMSPRQWHLHKRELTGELVRHLRQLHERGFRHRDCKATNVLVAPAVSAGASSDGRAVRLLWIDMDGLRSTRHVRLENELRPLLRLHVSLLAVPGLTRTDRVRFLRRYFARFGADPGAWRTVWRDLAPAAQMKIRRKAARRAWKLEHYGRE